VTLLAGRFQPLETVRPGAPMRARDLQTAQTVLLRPLTVDDEDRERTIAEARRAVGIFHPSLVTLFDVVDIPNDSVLLAYEFVTAQTVAHVAGGQPFHVKRAAQIAGDIADAVAELHARDVVHGGISTSTVLLSMTGRARLDRVGDPAVRQPSASVPSDVAAIGALLQELAGTGSRRGVPGAEAVQVLAARATTGLCESAAVLAAMLRRL
jgi:eukaryotic-like serine/threonine-protein kinase